MEKIRMHKKMAMTGKSPVMKMKSGGMAEDRALEGKKAAYRKMGFGKMMDSGEIDFGDKHPLLKSKKEKMKKYEHPMKEERFQRTRQEAIAKVVGKENVGDPRTKIKGYNN